MRRREGRTRGSLEGLIKEGIFYGIGAGTAREEKKRLTQKMEVGKVLCFKKLDTDD